MEQLNPSDLKAILHSKRANLYYLEHARVMQKDGRVLYLTEAKNENQYWNIPIANTTVILLGTGTSITQAAMRMLASAGVLVGESLENVEQEHYVMAVLVRGGVFGQSSKD